MNLDALKKLLVAGEWNDIEFKEARRDVPKSAFETVSAFANTHGGYLVFGVAQDGDAFAISGVERPDKVQNDFLSVLHADAKVNHDIEVQETRLVVEGKTILVFHIAENQRTRKPVYLDGDIRRTFVRKGGGDYKAHNADVEKLLRDASTDRWDSEPFEKVPFKDAIDSSSMHWYRERFHQINSGFDTQQSDRDFLYYWGFLQKDGRHYLPTRASVMLFGSPLAIHHIIPRPTLDVQFLGYSTKDPLPETRWIDRLVIEENIIQAWEQLVSKYRFFMPKPFRDIDPVTLGRRDDPPGFRVFREAAVNLLIHQDYGDHTRKAVIKFYRDGIQFWNPGDVFGDDSRLWEPGEKEVRNPSIAMAMRRIAMCEQAGTGLRMMREAWRKLGHPTPTYENDRARKSFEFFIPELDKEVDMASDLVKAMFGSKEPTQSSTQLPTQSTDPVMRLLMALIPEEKSSGNLREILGIRHRPTFRDNYLHPAIEADLIEYTIPDKPRSSKQKYRLTEAGRQALAQITTEDNQ